MIDLNHVEEYRENNRIEAKKAMGGLPHSIWETYSAFANAVGGVILLGVEEWKDKTLHTVDLPDPEGMAAEFWAKVNDPKIVSANILSPEQVELAVVEGDRIIAIHVPQAAAAQRPVYIGGDPFAGSYFRSGEGDFRIPRETVEQMLSEAADIRTAES